MTKTRFKYLLVVFASAALVLNTGAFSAVTADRQAQLEVAADEDAYLGIEAADITVYENRSNTTRLLTLTNRFNTPLQLAVTITEPETDQHPSLHHSHSPQHLDIGESRPVTADIVCKNSTDSERITIAIRATGDGIRVIVERQIEIACHK